MSGTAGVDEAGCGALMGDLVAAAVVLPEASIEGLADSKKLTAKRRTRLAATLRASGARIGVGTVKAQEIDQFGMGWARRAVLHRALDALDEPPRDIIVDGDPHFFQPYHGIPATCFPRADATEPCVSAASIIAKTERDARIDALSIAQPDLAERYGWKTNKGYPTRAHVEALRAHGATEHHRRSFGPCK